MTQGISGFGFSPSNPLSGWNPPQTADPSPFDVVLVAGQRNPGTVKVEGFKRKWKWDAKSAKGSFGEQLTFAMKHASTGSLTFFVWTEQQWDQWSSYVALFKYDPTKQIVSAVQIDTPLFTDLGLRQFVTVSIEPFRHLGEGLWAREVELIEWSPPPKVAAVSTPVIARSGAPSPVPGAPAPTDPLQLKIQNLYQQFSAP